MAVELRTPTPAWYESRAIGPAWADRVGTAMQGRDLRDNLRAEMLSQLMDAYRLVQRGEDWGLADVERFCTRLESLAVLQARIRASAQRDEED